MIIQMKHWLLVQPGFQDFTKGSTECLFPGPKRVTVPRTDGFRSVDPWLDDELDWNNLATLQLIGWEFSICNVISFIDLI